MLIANFNNKESKYFLWFVKVVERLNYLSRNTSSLCSYLEEKKEIQISVNFDLFYWIPITTLISFDFPEDQSVR